MNRKFIKVLLKAVFPALVMAAFSISVAAEESAVGTTQTGQTLVSYTPERTPVTEEIPKGNGTHVVSPSTGDLTMTGVLEILVIASASMLMLIIVMKKRRLER